MSSFNHSTLQGNAMPEQPDILVLAHQPEQAANLKFLLHLANFRAIHIADDIEAFNYLVQRQNSPHPVGLLLIFDVDINQPFLHLLEELKRRQALVPILLVRRDGPIDIDQVTSDPEIRLLLRQCDQSITHSCVREVLDGVCSNCVMAS